MQMEAAIFAGRKGRGIMAINPITGSNSLSSINSIIYTPPKTNILPIPSLNPLEALGGFDSKTRTVSDLAKRLIDSGFKLDGSNAANEAKDYLTTIKSASQTMRSALGSLTGTARNPAFMQFTPASSDTEKLTLDTSGAWPGAQVARMNINIDQLAERQVNQGTALTADANVGGEGVFEFAVQNNGNTYQFSIATTEQDTNRSLQDKIAAAINERDIGVTASVAQNTSNNTSALTIQSSNTGVANQFTVTDTVGDAISRAGVGAVTQQAQDAVYRINNSEQRTSSSNTIDLGSGIKANMLKASGDTIEVSMQADTTRAFGALNDFVRSYNDLITAAKGNDTTRALQLNYQLARTTNTYAASLNRIGVNLGTDGLMSINQDRLNSAASSGELQRFFNDGRHSNFGFANRMTNLANDINTSPMKFTDLSSLGVFNTTNNPYSPVQTLRYNQAYNSGLFLNMFV